MNNTQQQIAKTNSYSVKELTDMESVKKKFDDVLGKRAPQFITSLINIVNSDHNLQKATSSSVVASALVAASLNLPINPSLGYMYIIPYGHTATPQIGYKGYIQLAQRSGQYQRLTAIPVYADEFKSWNPLTEEIDYEPKFKDREDKEKPVGYLAFFQLINGFKKTVFWTYKQVDDHCKKFSKGNKGDKPTGVWKDNFNAMALKTVLRSLLTKWGPMTVDMQTADLADNGEYDHLDNERKDVTPNDDSVTQSILDSYDKEQTKEKPKEVEEASDNGNSNKEKATDEANQ
ncbi:recombinase RecT [Limosilactobacillus vaginalis]|uniref:recombinase RecT n=1 Tax=Limosilactobacillus vaginalis TaxID=1633 RepID=UPI0024BB7D76|nr:recombinase RecT [Limosilactobacillus vaginalis]